VVPAESSFTGLVNAFFLSLVALIPGTDLGWHTSSSARSASRSPERGRCWPGNNATPTAAS